MRKEDTVGRHRPKKPLLSHAVISLVLLLVATNLQVAEVVDASTLEGKVLLGYQGWFNCPGDGSGRGWRTWARGLPGAGTLTVDMYPDLSEFDPKDLCAPPGLTRGGRQAYLYTARNPNIVMGHFRWMAEYGLDGILLQRFVSSIERQRATGDVVLKNVLAAARKYGRVFCIDYDVSGAQEDTFWDIMRKDWEYLVGELKITSHPGYLHHHGKPVLSVWGIGYNEDRRPPKDPEFARQIIQWFKNKAPERYRVTYMGGTPSRWRTLSGDCRTDPRWAEVFRMMDVIQPWTVGRYRDEKGPDEWKDKVILPELRLTKASGQLYMPVIFPGFSWANLKNDQPNKIPRNGGKFLWRQACNAKAAGATVLKIAMFDEVNESTAIYKIAAKRSDAPDQGYWLTLDADGYDLPSDWYLRLAGEITKMFHGERPLSYQMPVEPKRLQE